MAVGPVLVEITGPLRARRADVAEFAVEAVVPPFDVCERLELDVVDEFGRDRSAYPGVS
jgi:hypothetical protein